jgi:hypothetical protein
MNNLETGVVVMQQDERNHVRHVFAIGSMVRFRSNSPTRSTGGPYKVLAKLPAQDGALQYRVKSASEPHQRILRQDDLEQA